MCADDGSREGQSSFDVPTCSTCSRVRSDVGPQEVGGLGTRVRSGSAGAAEPDCGCFLLGSWRQFYLPYCTWCFDFLAVHVGCEWRAACVVSGMCHVVALSAPLLDAAST